MIVSNMILIPNPIKKNHSQFTIFVQKETHKSLTLNKREMTSTTTMLLQIAALRNNTNSGDIRGNRKSDFGFSVSFFDARKKKNKYKYVSIEQNRRRIKTSTK